MVGANIFEGFSNAWIHLSSINKRLLQINLKQNLEEEKISHEKNFEYSPLWVVEKFLSKYCSLSKVSKQSLGSRTSRNPPPPLSGPDPVVAFLTEPARVLVECLCALGGVGLWSLLGSWLCLAGLLAEAHRRRGTGESSMGTSCTNMESSSASNLPHDGTFRRKGL